MKEENGKTFFILHNAYVNSVTEAGGLPLLIPHNPELAAQTLDALDGVLLTGGDDIDVRDFGQALHAKADLMPSLRQRSEFALLRAIDERPTLPVLGICLGMQLMGVHHGCPLIQHLHDVIADGDHSSSNPRLLYGCAMASRADVGRASRSWRYQKTHSCRTKIDDLKFQLQLLSQRHHCYDFNSGDTHVNHNARFNFNFIQRTLYG